MHSPTTTTATTTTTRPLTGRRKEAVARVRLMPGGGRVLVNGLAPLDYLKRETLVMHALHPLNLTNTVTQYGLEARVYGGGLTGQAGALRMAIARALLQRDE